MIRRQVRPQLQLDRMPPPIGERQHEVMPKVARPLLFVDARAVAGEAGPGTERLAEGVVVREQVTEDALREAFAVAALDGLEEGELGSFVHHRARKWLLKASLAPCV